MFTVLSIDTVIKAIRSVQVDGVKNRHTEVWFATQIFQVICRVVWWMGLLSILHVT
jgi:hypothetical protein